MTGPRTGQAHMPTGGLAHERVRWRRWGTGLVVAALGITVIAITVAFWRSKARREKALPVPRALPTNVNQQLSGYSFTRSVEGRQIFTVHAARTVAFKEGGTTVLEDVMVEVFGREGNRRDVLRTHVCEANVQSGSLFCAGRVQIELGAETGPAAAFLPCGGDAFRLPWRPRGSHSASRDRLS